ncbi:hypothetical protein PVAG01_10735 [Phlyctema vagabunda]|uniref:Heterokaryon incompatibility domain-containing protein n=1 Tax=Phlyctema vagabunda TaxID=108571 RepID=A0ABR4P327_9HELO
MCKILWDRLTTVPPDLDETGSHAAGYGTSTFSTETFSVAGFGVAQLGDDAMAGKIASSYYNIFPVDEDAGAFWISFSHLNNVVLRFRVEPRLNGRDSLLSSNSLSSSTDSELTRKCINSWVSECSSSHKICFQTHDDPHWLPTRLVDVGTTAAPQIHLHISADHKERGSYLTLSHCWGGQPALQLSTANITSLIKGIEDEEIPKTFLDAIHITRQLGIRWLWIDSLCIIQNGDNGVDKSTELVSMEKVYNRSYCNIAATWSPNSKGGCFKARNSKYICPLRVSVEWPWAATGTYEIYDFDMWQIDVLKSPLNSRGWVVQERLLAPRNLYFGAQQLSWECHTKDANEVFPEGLPKQMNWPRRFKTLDSDTDNSVETSWATLVELYSSCNLTFGGDKLTAFAGIAKHLSHNFKGDYVAGLWNGDLIWQLLWRPTFASRLKYPRENVKEYRAPSWSWASVDGEVAYHRNAIAAGVKLIEIVACKTEKVDSRNPTGAVKSGYLKIRGFISKAVRFKRIEGITPYALLLNGRKVKHGYALLDAPYIEKDDTTKEFLALPILTLPSKIESTLYCLVLLKTDEPDIYVRRGMFTIPLLEDEEAKEFFLGSEEKPKEKLDITLV